MKATTPAPNDTRLFSAIAAWRVVYDQGEQQYLERAAIHDSVEVNHPKVTEGMGLLVAAAKDHNASRGAIQRLSDEYRPYRDAFNRGLDAAGYTALDKEADASRKRCMALFADALAIPARTIEGLNSKLSMILEENASAADGLQSDEWEAQLIHTEWAALVGDIRRLGGAS